MHCFDYTDNDERKTKYSDLSSTKNAEGFNLTIATMVAINEVTFKNV